MPVIIYVIISLAGCDTISIGDSGFTMPSIPAPEGVSATDGDYTDRITITWEAVEEADYYRVYRCTTADGDYGDRPVGSDWTHITATTYTDRLVDSGDHFFYRVKAFTSDKVASDSSDADEGYTRLGPPAPTGVDATKGEGTSITVTWELNTEAEYYKVWRCDTPEGEYTVLEGADNIVPSGSTGTYEDTTAAASTYYFYKITAVNIVGESDLSAYAYGYYGTQPAPAPPTGISASDKTYSDRIVLTWTAGIGADSYTIYRAQWEKTGSGTYTTGPGTYTQIATGVTATTYSDTSSIEPGNYYYYITATNTTGTSSASAVDTGYRSITDREFVDLYEQTEGRLMQKIEDKWGDTPIGSETFYGDINGYVNYSSTFTGGSTGKVNVPYTNYVEFYIIVNGSTYSEINIWSPPGDTTGTLTITGIYPGTLELHLEVTTGGTSGGSYIVTQEGRSSSTVTWEE